ncbi:2-hydroxychromene-2-carboxylate isomerase, partial [Rhizobium brockwellii]
RLEQRPDLSDPTPASLYVISANLDGQDWIGVARAQQHAFWSEAKDIGKPDVREAIVTAAGFDGAALLRRQADDDLQNKWSA